MISCPARRVTLMTQACQTMRSHAGAWERSDWKVAATRLPQLPPRFLAFQATGVIDAVREILAHDTFGVIAQVVHAHQVIGLDHDEQGFLDGRGIRIVLDRILGAIDSGDVGAAPDVIVGNVHFQRGHGIDQILHAQDRIRRVFAFREAGDQFLEGIEGFACAFRVAFGQILAADVAEQAEILVEIDQPAQVINVIDVRMIRMQFDEAVAGGSGRSGFTGLPVGRGNVDLRLLGKAAVGVARLKLFKILDRFFVATFVKRFLGFGIEFVGLPADSFILNLRQQAASGYEEGKNKRCDNR